MRDPVALCVGAVAGWHTSWLTALGVRSETEDDAWRALGRPPHIYLAAITLRPDTAAAAVADAPGSICDAWHALELKPFGFEV